MAMVEEFLRQVVLTRIEEVVQREINAAFWMGRMLQRLDGHMDQVAEFMGNPMFRDMDPSMTALDAIITKLVQNGSAE